jgi:hypothetical protein
VGKAFGIGRGDGGKLAVRVDGVLFAKGNARSESRGLGGERGRSMMMRYHKDYSVSLGLDSLP